MIRFLTLASLVPSTMSFRNAVERKWIGAQPRDSSTGAEVAPLPTAYEPSSMQIDAIKLQQANDDDIVRFSQLPQMFDLTATGSRVKLTEEGAAETKDDEPSGHDVQMRSQRNGYKRHPVERRHLSHNDDDDVGRTWIIGSEPEIARYYWNFVVGDAEHRGGHYHRKYRDEGSHAETATIEGVGEVRWQDRNTDRWTEPMTISADAGTYWLRFRRKTLNNGNDGRGIWSGSPQQSVLDNGARQRSKRDTSSPVLTSPSSSGKKPSTDMRFGSAKREKKRSYPAATREEKTKQLNDVVAAAGDDQLWSRAETSAEDDRLVDEHLSPAQKNPMSSSSSALLRLYDDFLLGEDESRGLSFDALHSMFDKRESKPKVVAS